MTNQINELNEKLELMQTQYKQQYKEKSNQINEMKTQIDEDTLELIVESELEKQESAKIEELGRFGTEYRNWQEHLFQTFLENEAMQLRIMQDHKIEPQNFNEEREKVSFWYDYFANGQNFMNIYNELNKQKSTAQAVYDDLKNLNEEYAKIYYQIMKDHYKKMEFSSSPMVVFCREYAISYDNDRYSKYHETKNNQEHILKLEKAFKIYDSLQNSNDLILNELVAIDEINNLKIAVSYSAHSFNTFKNEFIVDQDFKDFKKRAFLSKIRNFAKTFQNEFIALEKSFSKPKSKF